MTKSHEHHEAEPQTGFKVVDRRRFTAAGDARDDAPDRNYAARPTIQAQASNAEQAGQKTQKAAQSAGLEAPKKPKSSVDFLSFVASLATQAMASMGLMPDAQARGIPVDPTLAHEYIEIIAMLEERTEGNLSPEETQAMQRLMGDLRLNFAEVQKRSASPQR